MKIGNKIKIVNAGGSYYRYNGQIGIIDYILPYCHLNPNIIVKFGDDTFLTFKKDELEIINELKPITFGVKAVINLNNGRQRIFRNLTEIHYCYESADKNPQTAFESNIHGTGYTLYNSLIKDFEIVLETEIAQNC